MLFDTWKQGMREAKSLSPSNETSARPHGGNEMNISKIDPPKDGFAVANNSQRTAAKVAGVAGITRIRPGRLR